MALRYNMDFVQNAVINFHDGYYLEDDKELISFYMRHVYSYLLSKYDSLNMYQAKAAYMYESVYFKGNADYDVNPRSLNMNNLIDFIEDFHYIQIGFA